MTRTAPPRAGERTRLLDGLRRVRDGLHAVEEPPGLRGQLAGGQSARSWSTASQRTCRRAPRAQRASRRRPCRRGSRRRRRSGGTEGARARSPRRRGCGRRPRSRAAHRPPAPAGPGPSRLPPVRDRPACRGTTPPPRPRARGCSVPSRHGRGSGLPRELLPLRLSEHGRRTRTDDRQLLARRSPHASRRGRRCARGRRS